MWCAPMGGRKKDTGKLLMGLNVSLYPGVEHPLRKESTLCVVSSNTTGSHLFCPVSLAVSSFLSLRVTSKAPAGDAAAEAQSSQSSGPTNSSVLPVTAGLLAGGDLGRKGLARSTLDANFPRVVGLPVHLINAPEPTSVSQLGMHMLTQLLQTLSDPGMYTPSNHG